MSMTSRASFYHNKIIEEKSLKELSEEKDKIINFQKMHETSKMNETSSNIRHFFKTTNSMKRLR